MTTRTDVLKIRMEVDGDGNVRASMAGVAMDTDKVTRSTEGVKQGLKDVVEANKESEQSFLSNSRAITSFQDLLDDLASGQLGRAKREVAALANETGLLARLFSGGAGAIAMTAGIGAVALAAAGLVVAYAKGEAQLDDFTRRLYATGQQGIETAADLEKIVDVIGASVGSYGKAADALGLVVSSGRYTDQEFASLSQTIVNFSALTGGELSDGLHAVESLTGQVGDGLLKLDAQYHFLTQSVYDQIVALQEQGETDKARELEQKAFADAVNQRADDVKAHLEPLASAWSNIESAASKAWRAMSQGPVDAINSEIKNVESWLSDARDVASRFANPMATYFNGGLSPSEVASNQPSPSAPDNAQADAQRKKLQEHENALNAFLADEKAGVPGFVAQAAEINKQRLLALSGVVDQKTIDQVNAAADQQIRDAVNRANAQYRGGSGGSIPKSKGPSALESFSQYVGNLTAQSQGNQMDDSAIGKYITGVEKLDAEFDKAIAKGAAVTAATADYDKGIQALGDDLAKAQAKQAAVTAAYGAQLDQELALRKQAIDLQVQSVGMGAKEVQQMQELNQIHQSFDQKLVQLNRDRQNGHLMVQQYDDMLNKLKSDEQAEIDAAINGYARMDAAMGDWRNGAIRAMEDMRDQFSDVAGQMDQTFTDAFGNMNQAIVQWEQTGKLSGDQFAKNLIGDLTQIELHVVESQILQSILGAFMPSGTGIASSYMAGGGASYAASGVNWNVGLLGSAQGNVFASPSLSQYSNQIVSQPTLFAFAQGAGVMGEGGRPEAIIPLMRTANGDLGVQAQGGSNVQVIVENHSDSQAQVQQSKDANGGDIIKVIVGQAVNEVNKQIGRGGSTYKVMQQTFGLSRRGVPVSGG